MNIILFGPPGAGKGTQAKFISSKFHYKQVSTGDLLRDEMKRKPSLKKKIFKIINSGDLVSDNIVSQLLENIISNPAYFNKLIFDGYPRNTGQITILENLLKKYKQTKYIVISLLVAKEVIKKRIMGRIYCQKCNNTFNEYFNPPTQLNHNCNKEFLIKRDDDNIDTILHRYETYIKVTGPVIEYYKKKNEFHEIDGNNDIIEISSKIAGIISNLTD